MDYSTGKLGFIFLVATALSVAGAWLMAWRFRAAMRRLMSAPAATGGPAVPVAEPSPATGAPAPLRVQDNRRAGRRLALLLLAISVLIALSSAALQLGADFGEGLLTPARLLTLAAVQLWPVIPALGLLWRWSRWRVFGTLLGWCVAAFVLLWWRSTAASTPVDLLRYLAVEIGPALLLVALLCLGNATRAVAPWLLPPMLGLVWASVAGVDLLDLLVQQRSPLLAGLSEALGAVAVMLLFAALPWLLAWWPLKALTRALAAAYGRRLLSELMVLFSAVWGIVLLIEALGAAGNLGPAGAVMLLPLAWIPLVMLLVPRPRPPQPRPPTLLVLRVFQRDRAMQALFDEVVERWRLSGNTLLIADTDLVERTLDAGDLFNFVDGRLGERFIHGPADIAARLAGFELQPDAEGRYRVNECYCHDSIWRETLDALVARSDVVLMDLRSFQRRNEGCRHELGVLARSARLARIVVLTDAQTDRGAAEAAAAGAAAGRFVWLDASTLGRRQRRAVLTALFAAA